VRRADDGVIDTVTVSSLPNTRTATPTLPRRSSPTARRGRSSRLVCPQVRGAAHRRSFGQSGM